jgi:Ala-tRNA(Pro) deacylase
MSDMDIQAFLSHHAIELARHEHAAVFTVAESELISPTLPGVKTKNLFLRDKKARNHFLVTLPADLVIDLIELGDALGAGRLSFASPERLLHYLGVSPGSVSVLGLVNDPLHQVQCVIEQTLWGAEAIQAHPLINTATMIVPHLALERFLAATGHVPRVIALDVCTAQKSPL